MDTNFEELINQYGSKVYNLAFRVTFNREDADDIVQETFLQVYKGIEDFRGESNVGTWIYRIALNNSLKVKKTINKKYIESLEKMAEQSRGNIPIEIQDWFEDPEKALLLKELTNEIRYGCQQVMMQELPDTQKIVFILRVIFDFSYNEISDILQVSQDVIKSRLKRARATLSRLLQQKCQWFREGGNNNCCKSNIGFVLAQDTEILKRVYERVNEVKNEEPRKSKLYGDYLAYIYKNLPELSFNSENLKKNIS